MYRKGGGREYVQEGVEGGVCVERGVKGGCTGSGCEGVSRKWV